MGVHWQVNFKSLRTASNYIVNIYDAAYSGTPVQLTGADRPFEVAEDDSDNMFIPVRKQSGYINIVDTGNVDWESIIPSTSTSRPVTVTKDASVIWQGYLQPQTFAGELYGNPQTRRLPVCCMLSVLERYDVAPTYAETADFGQVLGYIFSFIPSLTVGHIYIAGGAVDEWLKKRVDWANFREEDENNVPRSKYDAGQLLEEVCKFWGWTCRTFGTDIYLTAADSDLDPAFMVYDLQDLTSGTRQPSSVAWATKALSGDIFASTNNEDLIMLGIHKAEVTANINKFDSVMKADLDKYEDWLDRNSVAIIHRSIATDKHYFIRNSSTSSAEEVTQGEGIMKWDMGNCWLEMNVDMSTQPYQAAGNLFQSFYYEGSLADLHDIPFNSLLKVETNPYYPANPDFACARITSKNSLNFDHGVIVVEGNTSVVGVHSGVYREYNGRCDMTCRLKVGDKYWNGSAWTTTKSTFTISNCGGLSWAQGSGKILSNRTLDSNFTSPYPNYNGHGIPVDGNISGQLVFEILTLTSYGGSWWESEVPWCGFSTFEIKFLRAIAFAPLKDNNSKIYTGTIRNFTDDVNVTTIFASDNGFSAGMGIIMNSDNSYCEKVKIEESGGEYNEHPEQYLAERISLFGATTRRKLVIEVRDDMVQGITPGHRVTLDGSTFYPVSLSHQFRDDITTIILLEI